MNWLQRFIFQSVIILFVVSSISSSATAQKNVAFGNGITYMAKDTSFKVKFQFRMQNLLVVDYDQGSEEFSSQMLVRRARFKFDGFALNPKLEYKAEIGLSNRDISVNREDGNGNDASRLILDAVVKWHFNKHWSLWVGQTKLPGNRERVISSANLQFVDRSLVNSRFNIDRDVGLQLRGNYKVGEMILKPSFAVSQGEGRNITSSNFGGYDYTAHLEFLPFGKFANKGDFSGGDLEREPKPKLAIGLTYDYNDGAVRQSGQLGSFVKDPNGDYVENSLTTFMADLMFKYDGFSVMAEYGTKSTDNDIFQTSSSYSTGNGFTIQAGYLLDNNLEVAMRYTTIRNDNSFSGLKDEDEVTLGLSKYIVGHDLKIQTDLSRNTNPGLDDAKYRFRMQLEVQF
jgi:hypothetical protein